MENFLYLSEILLKSKRHTVRFLGEIKLIFFGNGILFIEMFVNKMFQIMCHMMACNHS